MNLGFHTAREYVRSVHEKLRVTSGTEAAIKYKEQKRLLTSWLKRAKKSRRDMRLVKNAAGLRQRHRVHQFAKSRKNICDADALFVNGLVADGTFV
jgi:hypothetical protein